MIIFLFFAMVFCHIVDDFYLQGILASMKQKDWWKKNYPEKLYKNDYMVALIIHAISWSFMIMLPIAVSYLVYNLEYTWWIPYSVLFVGNVIIHAIVDDQKANKHVASLVSDQVFHFAQIMMTYAFGVLCCTPLRG